MATEVRTPFSTTPIELSRGGLWKKQVLAFRTIDYIGSDGTQRKLTFTPEYGRAIVDAFAARAYQQVPLQLATADNRHNNDPLRTMGEVVKVEMSEDGSGVDAYIRTWGRGTRVVKNNPRLGVSARLFENTPQPDGRVFPVAMQHVLATVDPQIRDMNPWQQVDSIDLANGADTGALLDLSAVVYEGSSSVSGEKKTVLELSATQVERLEKILEDDEALEAIAAELGDDFLSQFDADDEDEDGDGGDEDEDEGGTGEVQLSGRHVEALELARAQIDSQGARITELSNQLVAQRVESELNGYLQQGLAPAVVEAARPLLSIESGAIDLSNGPTGDSIDPGRAVRDVLDRVIELARTNHLFVDLDETGSLEGNDQAQTERAALVADWESYG